MRKRIAIFTPNPGDATSFYRAFGVFGRLREAYDLEPVILKDVNWASLAFVDMAYVHRPDTQNHVQIIKMVKFQGKKVWVDYDDDLLRVPPENPSFAYFQQNAQYIKQAIALADVVTVSTEEIKNNLSEFNKNIHVIPNALDEKFSPRVRREKTGASKIVVWRGSNTHYKDLFDYHTQIISVMKARSDWKIFFLGWNPWFITSQLPQEQYRIFEPMDILHYFELIGKISPDVMIVPLSDNPFNHGKSDIAWLEGTMAGAVVVSPNWNAWPRTEYSYGSPETFQLLFQKATSGVDDLKKENEEQWQFIKDNRLLDKVNPKRVEIFKALMGES